jgi:hypothetical protein
VVAANVTTGQIFIEPCAVVVALPDEHITLCHEVFGQASIRVHAAIDPQVAADRITKVLPQIVVAPAGLPPDAREIIEDAAIAVGAVFVVLTNRPDYLVIERQLESGVAVARERFGKGSR